RVSHPQLFDHSGGRAGRDELLPAPHEPPSPDEGRVRDRSGTRHAQRPDPGGDGAYGGRRDSLQVGQAENPASGRGPRRGPDPRLGPVQVHEQGDHDRIVPAGTDPLTSDIRTPEAFLSQGEMPTPDRGSRYGTRMHDSQTRCGYRPLLRAQGPPCEVSRRGSIRWPKRMVPPG